MIVNNDSLFQFYSIILGQMEDKQVYEPCPIHTQEFLQVVCLECELNSIACPICIDLSHKNHNMISLKKFIATELPKLYVKKPDYHTLTKGIGELGATYQALFEKMRKMIGHELNQLQKVFQGEVQALQQESSVVCGVGDRIYTHQNISLIKRKIKNQEKIPDTKTFTARIADLAGKMECLVGEVTEDVCEVIRGLSCFWEETKQLLLNSRREFKFTFSPSLKHKGLSLEMNNWRGRKIVNELYDNSYHIGVVEPPLNPFKNQISFRVQKSTNRCVWIGVCDLRKIIDKRFSNCYKKGEGGYWVWQAGCQGGAQYFSSLLSESQPLPWTFDVGEVVRLRIIYQKDNRFVEFSKNKGKPFRGRLQKANVYCACVAMGAQGQSVIIMEE